MCLAVPARVLSLDLDAFGMPVGTVLLGSVEKKVAMSLVDGVKVGDSVLVHVGFAISVLDEDAAESQWKLLEEAGIAQTQEEVNDGGKVEGARDATS